MTEIRRPLGLVAYAKFRKVKPPEKSIASAKQTAAIMQNVKPHPRAVDAAAQDKAAVVARSSA